MNLYPKSPMIKLYYNIIIYHSTKIISSCSFQGVKTSCRRVALSIREGTGSTPIPGFEGTMIVPFLVISKAGSTISFSKYLELAEMSFGNLKSGREARWTLWALPIPGPVRSPAGHCYAFWTGCIQPGYYPVPFSRLATIYFPTPPHWI